MVAVLAALALGCAQDAPAERTPGSQIAGLMPAPVDFGVRGPYPVGTMTIEADATQAVVYYPADPSAIERTKHVTSYNLGDALAPELRAYIAPAVPELVQDIPLDAYQRAPINAEGPFPIVLHSHGTGGSPLVESAHLQHLASWGFVVAAPEHRARDLDALATGSVVDDDTDERDLRATLDALGRENTRPASPLLTGMDTTSVAVEGLDAGATAAYRFAVGEPRVKAWIGQAPTALATTASLPPAQLRRSALIITGDQDSLVPLADVQAQYDAIGAPKRLAVLPGAGHASFVDACTPIRRTGGLGRYAAELPALIPLLERNDDGCAPGNLDPARARAYIDHLSVAAYREAFGSDATDVSLREEFLRRTFPEAAGPLQSAPAP